MICQQVRQWIIQIGIGYHAAISIVFDSYFHTGEKMFKSDFQLFFFNLNIYPLKPVVQKMWDVHPFSLSGCLKPSFKI